MLKIKNISIIMSIVLMIAVLVQPYFLFAQTLYQGGEVEVKGLSDEIKARQEKIKELSEKINDYNKAIKEYQGQSVSLSSQVNYLTARIEKTETETELTENEISENALKIQETENKIKQNETDIKNKKDILRDFIQEIYKADTRTEIEILLGNESFSEFYNHLESLNILQEKTNETLKDLKKFKEDLAIHITELEQEKLSLKGLKDKLEKNKETLEEQKITKQNILSQTRNSEYRFQLLLSQVKAEQAQVNVEIADLEKKIRAKLAQGGVDKLKALGEANFIWPVPNTGITAYFHDPSYPFRYIFEHPAVDIRSKQGSMVRASSSGYLARVKISNTARYGYIMIVHNDGFSTVYGHITKAYVQEDQFVTQGEVIALSGGMPGTIGSGSLSTGPHLHFEIRKNGIPVNPLDYLP